jgi:hypothetical protein
MGKFRITLTDQEKKISLNIIKVVINQQSKKLKKF